MLLVIVSKQYKMDKNQQSRVELLPNINSNSFVAKIKYKMLTDSCALYLLLIYCWKIQTDS